MGKRLSFEASKVADRPDQASSVLHLTFQYAQLRLVGYVRERIRNGELTERAFARQIGISQPHAHNVLKGIRNLSPEILDAILKRFRLSLLDLAPETSLEACLEKRQAAKRSAA